MGECYRSDSTVCGLVGIRVNGDNPHRRTKIEKVRSSYTEKLGCKFLCGY